MEHFLYYCKRWTAEGALSDIRATIDASASLREVSGKYSYEVAFEDEAYSEEEADELVEEMDADGCHLNYEPEEGCS